MKISIKPPKLFTKQNVVTASRSLSTVFQNTTSKPMLCCVTVRIFNSGAGIGAVRGLIGLNNPPTISVADGGNNVATVSAGNNNLDIVGQFLVMPKFFYEVSIVQATAILQIWTEWT